MKEKKDEEALLKVPEKVPKLEHKQSIEFTSEKNINTNQEKKYF